MSENIILGFIVTLLQLKHQIWGSELLVCSYIIFYNPLKVYEKLSQYSMKCLDY